MREVVLACVLVAICSAAEAQPSTLTGEKDIAEAIEWGISGDPQPYPLRFIERPGRVNPLVIGRIYTPFVRVALAAQAAGSP